MIFRWNNIIRNLNHPLQNMYRHWHTLSVIDQTIDLPYSDRTGCRTSYFSFMQNTDRKQQDELTYFCLVYVMRERERALKVTIIQKKMTRVMRFLYSTRRQFLHFCINRKRKSTLNWISVKTFTVPERKELKKNEY